MFHRICQVFFTQHLFFEKNMVCSWVWVLATMVKVLKMWRFLATNSPTSRCLATSQDATFKPELVFLCNHSSWRWVDIRKQNHPGGPKTVLMKTQFLKKTCVSPQRGNNLYPWKSVKFGRPNLRLFLGNCVFTSVKHHFVIDFDRASITLLSFHFICRNISTVFSSSFLYLFTKRHCHILAYNITSLCLAPKEFGMIFLQLVHGNRAKWAFKCLVYIPHSAGKQ